MSQVVKYFFKRVIQFTKKMTTKKKKKKALGKNKYKCAKLQFIYAFSYLEEFKLYFMLKCLLLKDTIEELLLIFLLYSV